MLLARAGRHLRVQASAAGRGLAALAPVATTITQHRCAHMARLSDSELDMENFLAASHFLAWGQSGWPMLAGAVELDGAGSADHTAANSAAAAGAAAAALQRSLRSSTAAVAHRLLGGQVLAEGAAVGWEAASGPSQGFEAVERVVFEATPTLRGAWQQLELQAQFASEELQALFAPKPRVHGLRLKHPLEEGGAEKNK